jgi:phosphoribosylformimino-5-aminoimidazole carboxamide ribonucleotide (ProFAR) isomerase
VAGGFRTVADVDAALAMGAARVVLDTEALDDPEAVSAVVATHGDRVVVGISSEGNRVFAPRSGLHDTDLEALLVQARDTKAHGYLITDVDSRGMRKTHERHALDTVIRSVHGHAISGGGVFRLGDLHALTELIPHGLDGAVIDAALYTGGFTFSEAVVALQERYDLFFWGPPQA